MFMVGGAVTLGIAGTCTKMAAIRSLLLTHLTSIYAKPTEATEATPRPNWVSGCPKVASVTSRPRPPHGHGR